MAVKRCLLRESAKAGGGVEVICACEYHEKAYNEFIGASSSFIDGRYNNFSDGATILSQAITITEECCVLTVGTIILRLAVVTDFELERPLGSIVVDQEDETLSSALYALHYAAWEVLPAGTYTYYLVNRGGGVRRVYGAQLKIVAFSCVHCVCAYHASAYNEFTATVYTDDSIQIFQTTFSDGATILSQAITTTALCGVFVVGTIVSRPAVVTNFELERPLGSIVVDQEDETTSRFIDIMHYAAWEVLPAGTYTYYLVNRAGGDRYILIAQLKIIAVTCAVV